MLTGRASETDRVRGFARGADDYLVKPFHYPELAARIGAVLRRSQDRRAPRHPPLNGIRSIARQLHGPVSGPFVTLR
jgi:two-component system, OmpR family, response regulator CpxR